MDLKKNLQKRIHEFQKDFSGYKEVIECLTSNFVGQNLKRQQLKITDIKLRIFCAVLDWWFHKTNWVCDLDFTWCKEQKKS